MCLQYPPDLSNKTHTVQVSPRLTKSPEQARRIDSLVKQATDALHLLAEERLNLDSESRDELNIARGAVAIFSTVVSEQPTK
jgi:hypothetical protein